MSATAHVVVVDREARRMSRLSLGVPLYVATGQLERLAEAELQSLRDDLAAELERRATPWDPCSAIRMSEPAKRAENRRRVKDGLDERMPRNFDSLFAADHLADVRERLGCA